VGGFGVVLVCTVRPVVFDVQRLVFLFGSSQDALFSSERRGHQIAPVPEKASKSRPALHDLDF
jgi:hypothetical protein